jgi:PKD repeat protein
MNNEYKTWELPALTDQVVRSAKHYFITASRASSAHLYFESGLSIVLLSHSVGDSISISLDPTAIYTARFSCHCKGTTVASSARTDWIKAPLSFLALTLVFALPARHVQGNAAKAATTIQKPTPSGQVKPGVSTVQFATVPDLTGLTPAQARQSLDNAGLRIGDVEIKDKDGLVISQSLAPLGHVLLQSQVNITVARPRIALTIDNDHPAVGDPVKATATISPPISNATYIFKWGDDTEPDVQTATATHSYKTPGSYVVLLTIRVADSVLQQQATINVQAKGKEPEYGVTLEAGTSQLEAGSAARFIAKLNPDPGPDQDVEYCFIWKDGSGDTCKTIRSGNLPVDHYYESPGVYSVTVSASVKGRDRFFSAPIEIRVLPAIPTPTLVVGVSLHPAFLQPEINKPDLFTAILNRSPNGKKVEYCFLWGDGSPENCQTATAAAHAYSSGGRYQASVRVLVNGKEVAQSAPVEISPRGPLWSRIWLYILISLGTLVAAYATRKLVHRLRERTTSRTISTVKVKVLHDEGSSHFEIIHPELLKTRCLIRVRWVRTPITAMIVPPDHLVKKKGTTHG